ncbi:MAG: 2-dehydropantoate 2-reductase [Gammaproteobacteria bacterium]|nr:2-dehydropantoate 2-reductase [Gammaproteobacteria bacterium]
MGAGGIGGYCGARLQAAGHEVVLVARGAHLAALREQGLQLVHPQFRFAAPVHACDLQTLTRAQPARPDDVLLVCVKAMSTAELAGELGAWIGAVPATVLSLQNGVDNEAELAAVLGRERVIGGTIRRLGGHVTGPGRIEATGPAQTTIGPWPTAVDTPALVNRRVQVIADAFNAAGIPTEISADVRRVLWHKLVVNNGVNPLSALVRKDTRSISHDPLLSPIVLAMMQETALAAAADDVALGAADVEEMYELIRGFDAIKTSMLVDREHGRPLEIEAIPGAVVRRADRIGAAVAHTRTVYALLRHLA